MIGGGFFRLTALLLLPRGFGSNAIKAFAACPPTARHSSRGGTIFRWPLTTMGRPSTRDGDGRLDFMSPPIRFPLKSAPKLPFGCKPLQKFPLSVNLIALKFPPFSAARFE